MRLLGRDQGLVKLEVRSTAFESNLPGSARQFAMRQAVVVPAGEDVGVV